MQRSSVGHPLAHTASPLRVMGPATFPPSDQLPEILAVLQDVVYVYCVAQLRCMGTWGRAPLSSSCTGVGSTCSGLYLNGRWSLGLVC